jgi:hypothetical protein
MSEAKELVVDNGGPGKITTIVNSEHAWLDAAKFDQAYRVANAMAAMSLVPNHLKGQDKKQTAANCFLIVMQAGAWEMSPFQLMAGSYIVHGKLCYEGKVVASVVNTRAGLSGRLSYNFSGKSMSRSVTVSGTFKGEDQARTFTGSVAELSRGSDNDMWKFPGAAQDQKLAYVGAMWWCRRHCPEVIHGIAIVEERGVMDKIEAASEVSLMPTFQPPNSQDANDLDETTPAEEKALVDAIVGEEKPPEMSPKEREAFEEAQGEIAT